LAASGVAGSSRVVLVRPAGSDALLAEATTRLSAELTAAGFLVTVLDAAPGTDPKTEVESQNLDPAPVATLALSHLGASATADVWVADRVTGKTLVRHVNVGPAARDRAPTVLAVRAVELLRASLLEATTPQAARSSSGPFPVPDDVAKWMSPSGPATPNAGNTPSAGSALDAAGSAPAPAEPSKPNAVAPAPSRPVSSSDATASEPSSAGSTKDFARDDGASKRVHFTAELGAGGIFGVHGAGAALAPVVRGAVGSSSLAGRLSIVAPAFGAHVATAGGSASIRQELAALEIVGTWPRRSVLSVVGSIGAGALHWHIAGTANAPNLAHSGDAWAAVADVGVGGRLRLGGRSGVLLDVHSVFLTPRPAVEIAGREAASASEPLAVVTLGFVEAF
jgi:hypothetical protein